MRYTNFASWRTRILLDFSLESYGDYIWSPLEVKQKGNVVDGTLHVMYHVVLLPLERPQYN